VKLVTSWRELPRDKRDHLDDRLTRVPDFLTEATELNFWMLSEPDVPEGDWFKDFGKFKLCGHGKYPTTILDATMVAWGEEVR
jgi:hypothetical protein